MTPTQPFSWSDAILRLDRETTASARDAFERGRRSGFALFVIRPALAGVRALGVAPPGRRVRSAVLAAYGALVHAAKLWDLERRWREQAVVTFREGRHEVVALRNWRPVVHAILQGRLESEPITSGRGGARRLRSENGPLVARQFRRGGAMRWLGTLYFGLRSRPVQEFWLLLAARRRGLPVPEPVAALTERVAPFAYRGMLVMVEVPSAEPLWERLRRSPGGGLLPRVAASLRRVHDAGLWHPDLNLNNVLVTEDSRFFFVDLDRSRLSWRPLGTMARRRTLKRLRRSARKLDPGGAVVGDRDLDALEETYWSAPGLEAGVVGS